MEAGDAALSRGTVAVLGPGRVGTTLAAALVRAGHRVVAVAGGSRGSQRRFVSHVAGARAHRDPADAARAADLVLVTTPDDAIAGLVTAVAVAEGFREGQRVVHTSGAHGLQPVRRAGLAGARVAACHPAQTFPAGVVDPDRIVGTAWAVTAPAVDRGWAHDLVTQLGGDAHDVPEDARILYHAALTVGANAAGAAVAAARQLLTAASVEDPAAFLTPLVRASVADVLTSGATAITGSVVRGDVGTIRSHLDRLRADAPHLGHAYRHFTAAILAIVGPGLDPDTVAAITAAVAPSVADDERDRPQGATEGG